MKNKKKLLVAVAAMGLLAVGTAGVGTAAWYQAAQKATLSSATKYTVTTSAGTLDDIALKVVFTISQENGVELTAAASETTKYHSNGEDMPKTSPKTVGEFYVTNVTWDTSDPNYSDSKKNSLAAATYEVTLGSEGNVNILASSSWAASNGTLKFKFSVADGGALSLKTDGGMTGMTYAASKITGHYRVKANNESGLEYVEYDPTQSYAIGDKVTYKGKLYTFTAALAATVADTPLDTSKCGAPTDNVHGHVDDKIVISSIARE